MASHVTECSYAHVLYMHVAPTLQPYRHSEEMIEKLESTGLGFYVKATETQQKLGKCANA